MRREKMVKLLMIPLLFSISFSQGNCVNDRALYFAAEEAANDIYEGRSPKKAWIREHLYFVNSEDKDEIEKYSRKTNLFESSSSNEALQTFLKKCNKVYRDQNFESEEGEQFFPEGLASLTLLAESTQKIYKNLEEKFGQPKTSGKHPLLENSKAKRSNLKVQSPIMTKVN